MKKFILKVSYKFGGATMIVDTPNIIDALKQLEEKNRDTFKEDKYFGLPNVVKAEIIPLTFTGDEDV